MTLESATKYFYEKSLIVVLKDDLFLGILLHLEQKAFVKAWGNKIEQHFKKVTSNLISLEVDCKKVKAQLVA